MNSKKIVRLIAAALALIMCMTACATTSTGTKTESTAPSQAEDSTTVAATKNYWEMLDEVSDTSELPDWTGDTLDVNIWCYDGNDTIFGTISDTNVTFKELERVTGIRIIQDECFGNNGDSIDAKLPKLIASKDFPTIAVGASADNQMRELFENGYLADLTDYYMNGDLDQVLNWLPLEEMDALYDSFRTEDGRYYLISDMGANTAQGWWDATGYFPEGYDPTYYSTYAKTPSNAGDVRSILGIYVREDILQELYPNALTSEEIRQIYLENGSFTKEQIFDIPLNSAEDFYQFLRDVKNLLDTGDYTGLDGKPMEVTWGPDVDEDNWNWLVYLPGVIKGFSSSFNYFVTSDRSNVEGENLLEYAFTSDEYVQLMKELNALVNEDIIAKNSVVDNSAAHTQKINNCHYAVGYGYSVPLIHDMETDEYSYRPVWVNVDSDYDFGGYLTVSTSSYFGIFKDGLTDAQLDQLVHAINYLYSDVGYKNFIWGPASAGLFTEDADGNRTYTDPEVEAAMMYNEDNGAACKYGLVNRNMSDFTFQHLLCSPGYELHTPAYLTASTRDRDAKNAFVYYNPGTLEGMSREANSIFLLKDCNVHSSFGQQLEGNQQFWSARAGFENQVKKVIVAAPGEFDKELANLVQYTTENGLTEENLAAFNKMFVDANRDILVAAGVLK